MPETSRYGSEVESAEKELEMNDRHYKVAPEPLSEEARRKITGRDEMTELRKCALCGHESADAIQVGGHEPGSQRPIALYHCLHIPSCKQRQAENKIMALVSEYADCRDEMDLLATAREIIEIARSWRK